MSDFTTYRELVPYLTYEGFRPAAEHGKCGALYLSFECEASGRTVLRRLERRAPLIVQQALYFDRELPQMPCVYILSAGGPNVDGDRYRHHFTLGAGAMAFISTGAATKVAEMEGNFAHLQQLIELDERAYLEYLPEPVIPCRHTRYVTDTTLCVAPTATAVYGEIFMPGRRHHGERFAYDVLSLTCRVQRPDGQLLFREKNIIEPGTASPDQRGIMGGYELFGTLLIVTPPAVAEQLRERLTSEVDEVCGVAVGVAQLPGGAGLLCRLLGRETEPLKRRMRLLASEVRRVVQGCPIPEEFPWR